MNAMNGGSSLNDDGALTGEDGIGGLLTGLGKMNNLSMDNNEISKLR